VGFAGTGKVTHMNLFRKMFLVSAIVATALFLAGISPNDGLTYVRASANVLEKLITGLLPQELPMTVLEERIAKAGAGLAGYEVDLSLCSKQIEHDKGEVQSLSEKITRARRLLAAAVPMLEVGKRDHADTLEFAGRRRSLVEFGLEIDQLIATRKSDEAILARQRRALVCLKEQHDCAQIRIARSRLALQDAKSKLREIKVRWEIAQQATHSRRALPDLMSRSRGSRLRIKSRGRSAPRMTACLATFTGRTTLIKR
jgi:hypothetical protein